MSFRTWTLRGLATTAALVLWACGPDAGPTEPEPRVARVRIDEFSWFVVEGGTQQFRAVALDEAGAPMAGKTITWQSSRPDVAAVSASGVVTAGRSGWTYIRATADGVSEEIGVAVFVVAQAPSAGATEPLITSVANGRASVLRFPGPSSLPVNARFIEGSFVMDDRYVAESFYEVWGDSAAFSTPTFIEIGYPDGLLPAVEQEQLRLFRTSSNGHVELTSTVDVGRRRVSARIAAPMSVYILRRGQPASMSVVAGDGQEAPVGSAVPVTPVVRVVDASARPVPRAPVEFAVTQGGGTITGAGIDTTDADGRASLPGTWTLGSEPGANTLRATVVGYPSVPPTSVRATGAGLPMPQYELSTDSVTVSHIQGAPSPADVSVRIAVPGDTAAVVGPLSVAVSGDSASWLTASLDTSMTPARVVLRFNPAGVATGASRRATVTVSSTGLGLQPRTLAVSLDVRAGTPSSMAIVSAPTSGFTGVALGPVQVALRNEFGVVINAPLDVTLSATGTAGAPTGTTVRPFVAGTATFSDVSFSTAGIATLRLEASDLPAVTTDGIEISQRIAGMRMLVQPSAAVRGGLLDPAPAVELIDDAGNRIGADGATVTASLASGTGVLFGTATRPAAAGVVTFPDLGVEGTGAHRLRFRSEGLADLVSADFDVAAGPPGIWVLVGATPSVQVRADSTIDVPIVVDLSNRGSLDLGALSVEVTWAPGDLTFVSTSGGNWVDSGGGNAVVEVNATDAASGRIRIAGFTLNATTASFTLGTLRMSARSAAIGRHVPIGITLTAAGDALGADLPAQSRGLTLEVLP